MGHVLYNGYTTHDPWVVQWLQVNWISMDHRLCNTNISNGPWIAQCSYNPWSMGCTMVMGKLDVHGPWVVQCSCDPWDMDCTMLTSAMGHGLHNSYGLYSTHYKPLISSGTHQILFTFCECASCYTLANCPRTTLGF